MKKGLLLLLLILLFFVVGCEKKEDSVDDEEVEIKEKTEEEPVEEPVEENFYYDDKYYDENYKTEYWEYAKNIKVNKEDIEVYKKDGLAIYYAGMTEEKKVYKFWFKLINTTDYKVVDQFLGFAINDVSIYGGSGWKDVDAHSAEMFVIQSDKYWLNYAQVKIFEEINFLYTIGKCNREDSCIFDYTEIASSSDNNIVIQDIDYVQKYDTDKELIHEHDGVRYYMIGIDPIYPQSLKIMIENKSPYDLEYYSVDVDDDCSIHIGTSYTALSGDYAYVELESYTKKIVDFPDGKVCFNLSYYAAKDPENVRYSSETIYYNVRK